MLGLALHEDGDVRSTLIDLGIDSVARESKVSIARFERLVLLLRDALQQPMPLHHPATDASRACTELSGASVWLAHLWVCARSKGCLLDFLAALQEHAPARHQLFVPSAGLTCEAWRAEFEAEAFGDEVMYFLGGGSRSVAPSESELEALCTGGEPAVPHAALERLAYTLAARAGCAPEIPQQVHGYRGQPPIADCVEACVREALGLALWDRRTGRHDPSHLPQSSDPELVAFFGGASSEAGDHDRASSAADASKVWFDLVSARPGLDYMLGRGGGADANVGSESEGACEGRDDAGETPILYAYELFPSISNFAATFASLLGVPVSPPEASAPPVPIWPGSPSVWQRAGCDRHPVLLVRRGEDEMRVVFNGARHCYSLRDATQTEPAWIGRVRRAWKRRLDGGGGSELGLRPVLHDAAARMLGLGLRGMAGGASWSSGGEGQQPLAMARHELLHWEQRRRDAELG